MADAPQDNDAGQQPPDTSSGKTGYKTLVISIVVALIGVAAGIGIGAAIWAGSSKETAQQSPSVPVGVKLTDKSTSVSETISRTSSQLYVVDSPTGYAAKGDGDSWTLTMPKVNPVLSFADRPVRDSSEISAEALATTWNDEFASSPPNAALLATFGPGTSDDKKVAVVIPKAPTFDAASNTLTFVVTPDKAPGTTGAASDTSWLSQLTKESAAQNGRVVLFIDSSSYTINFTIYAGRSDFVFTPSYGPSNCAVPQNLKFTGYYEGGTGRAVYSGSAYINDEGSCFFETSKAYWNVTAGGKYNGNLEIWTSLGNVYLDCSDEGRKCGWDRSGGALGQFVYGVR